MVITSLQWSGLERGISRTNFVSQPKKSYRRDVRGFGMGWNSSLETSHLCPGDLDK